MNCFSSIQHRFHFINLLSTYSATMPPNLSVAPTPILLTDRFGLEVLNKTHYFHTNTVSALSIHQSDYLIGMVSFGIIVSFMILAHLYCIMTHNQPQWRLRALWRLQIRPNLRSRQPHVSPQLTDGQLEPLPAMGLSYGGHILQDMEADMYDSQETTLGESLRGESES